MTHEIGDTPPHNYLIAEGGSPSFCGAVLQGSFYRNEDCAMCVLYVVEFVVFSFASWRSICLRGVQFAPTLALRAA